MRELAEHECNAVWLHALSPDFGAGPIIEQLEDTWEGLEKQLQKQLDQILAEVEAKPGGKLRAKGPFTQLILGVTILMDVVVITLFAMSLSLAHSLIDGRDFSALFLAEIAFELIASGLLGWLLGTFRECRLESLASHERECLVLQVAPFLCGLSGPLVDVRAPVWSFKGRA